LDNDCARAVVSASPLDLRGDNWFSEDWQMNGGALVIVFPFEDRLHDYGHVQVFLQSLFQIIDVTFLSYTSAFLFPRRTEHILAASRRMALDAEKVLMQTRAPWFKKASSARFACSTMHTSVPVESHSVASSYDTDVCVQEDQMQVNGTMCTEALGADGVPLMVAVAVGATGKCRSPAHFRHSSLTHNSDHHLPFIGSSCARFPADIRIYPEQSSIITYDTPLAFLSYFAFAPSSRAIPAIFPAATFGAGSESGARTNVSFECEWVEYVVCPHTL